MLNGILAVAESRSTKIYAAAVVLCCRKDKFMSLLSGLVRPAVLLIIQDTGSLSANRNALILLFFLTGSAHLSAFSKPSHVPRHKQ